MPLKFNKLLAAAGFASVALAATIAVAQDDMMTMPDVSAMSVDEIIELRQDTMKSNGGTMRGAGALSGDEAIAAGKQLQYNSQLLMELFPEGSNTGDSKALDNIWTDNEAFMAILTDFETHAGEMIAAAEAGDADAYAAAVKAVGGQCGMCHGTYRAK
ncbi:c-type cytochrome [Cucumibacter marinus]|uniref:c-type cytochrome n=1 Tax=Cucumibacter marinus TaxID=1121252 RepID=UPI0003F7AC0D|nr:cytochrome c [Cucumibacter marinus]